MASLMDRKPMMSVLVFFGGAFLTGVVSAKILWKFGAFDNDSWTLGYKMMATGADIDYMDYLLELLLENMGLLFSVWILSVTALGRPYIWLLAVKEGAVCGFTLCMMLTGYGAAGLLMFSGGYLPQVFLYLPVIFFTIKWSHELWEDVLHAGGNTKLIDIRKHIKRLLLLVVAAAAGILSEVYLGSRLIMYIARKLMI